MAKVHFVRKAAKSNCRLGIKRGQCYWYIWRRRGRKGHKVVFLHPPKPSELANSPLMRRFLQIKESIVSDDGKRVWLIELRWDVMESLNRIPNQFREGQSARMLKSLEYACKRVASELGSGNEVNWELED